VIEEKRSEETPQLYKIRRDMEIRYLAELQPVAGVEGSLVSRNYVIPHLLIYNIEPQDYERIVHFTKRKAYGKMYRALTMLLDLADAVEMASERQNSEKNPVPTDPTNEEPKKTVVKVLGGNL